jgi:ribosomal protein S1
MKQLQPDPWVEVIQRFKTGQIVKGTIMRIVPFGAFISIDGLVEGLIHISELSVEHVKTVSDVVSVGQEVEAKIIKLIPEEQKIGLTLKLPKEKKLSETQSPETDVVPDVVEKKIIVDQDTPPTMETMVKKALDEG